MQTLSVPPTYAYKTRKMLKLFAVFCVLNSATLESRKYLAAAPGIWSLQVFLLEPYS